MSDFILKGREFDVVPNLLLEAVPNFSQSDEFKALDDGVNTYFWDARNQLTAISGGISASFAYDAFGRRISKTVSSQKQPAICMMAST